MQPVPIISLLKLSIEARAAEACVDGGESGEDAGEQFLEREERRVGSGQEGDQGVEGGGRGGVGGVKADADDGEVFARGVVRVYEDAADFYVGLFFGLGWILRVWMIIWSAGVLRGGRGSVGTHRCRWAI